MRNASSDKQFEKKKIIITFLMFKLFLLKVCNRLRASDKIHNHEWHRQGRK